jgi:pimeloyl-ACP methyl ester carboxylesterase
MLGEFEEVWVQVGDREWNGSLAVPQGAVGLVIFAFANGTNSAARDRTVAEALRARGLATLECDLFEETDDRLDIGLATSRLLALTDWVVNSSRLSHLPIGYVGVGTSAAAVLAAAARRADVIRAVVTRGGRPDLAGDALPIVTAPTLLIAGGHDEDLIELDRAVIEQMTALTQLAIIPGAGHTFEEPGALDEVIALATEWLVDYFRPQQARVVAA